MESEHPKMLYRLGTAIEHEGKSLDTLVVHDAETEDAARKEGFSDLADVKPRAKK